LTNAARKANELHTHEKKERNNNNEKKKQCSIQQPKKNRNKVYMYELAPRVNYKVREEKNMVCLNNTVLP
jgi:hypothetical protein